MQQRIWTVLLLFAGMAATTACHKDFVRGNGTRASEHRQVSNFTAIQLNGSGKVNIVKGQPLSVTVTDDGNLLPYIETRVEHNELTIGYKSNAHVRHGNLVVTIVMPEVNGAILEGSGDFTITGDFVTAGTFNTRISGSGSIAINGRTANHLDAEINGSGKIRASGLQVNTAKVTISGSGNAEVRVNDQLEARIYGSGHIYYWGTPAVTTRISGSGKVEKY
jgi:hypothetical protein